MSTVKCESCGAPLKVIPGAKYIICEYCGTQTVLEQSDNNVLFAEQTKQNSQNLNVIILSIPSCGPTVFQKKIFNIYRSYAELVDVKSRTVDIHIDYCSVISRTSFLGTSIIFKMNDGQKILIKTLTWKNYRLAEQALKGLV